MNPPPRNTAKYLFWAVKQQTGNTTRNLILHYLADHMGKEGCFPSFQTLADRAQCSRRSVITHINKLESDGYLTRQKRASNGMSSSNKYHLNLENQGVKEVHQVVKELHHPSAGGSLGVVKELHPETPSIKHPTKLPVKHTPITPSPFDIFYGAYPKKVKRQDAARAWEKLNPSEALINRMMLDIVQRVEQGAWCTGKDKAFIPGPAPYINQALWTDEIIPRPEFKKPIDYSKLAREAEYLV